MRRGKGKQRKALPPRKRLKHFPARQEQGKKEGAWADSRILMSHFLLLRQSGRVTEQTLREVGRIAGNQRPCRCLEMGCQTADSDLQGLQTIDLLFWLGLEWVKMQRDGRGRKLAPGLATCKANLLTAWQLWSLRSQLSSVNAFPFPWIESTTCSLLCISIPRFPHVHLPQHLGHPLSVTFH